MSVVEVLRQARGYVAAGWCQESMAVDRYGSPVAVDSDEVCRVCIIGALQRAVPGNKFDPLYLKARQAVQDVLGGCCAAWWNDELGRTQADVLMVFDQAILKAEVGG